jgi:hypothetical protein
MLLGLDAIVGLAISVLHLTEIDEGTEESTVWLR